MAQETILLIIIYILFLNIKLSSDIFTELKCLHLWVRTVNWMDFVPNIFFAKMIKSWVIIIYLTNYDQPNQVQHLMFIIIID